MILRRSPIAASLLVLLLVLLPAAAVAASSEGRGNGPCASGDGGSGDPESLYATHPTLCELLDRLEADPEGLASEMTEDARRRNILVGDDLRPPPQPRGIRLENHGGDQLPVVFAHGMGDSCFNSGMINIGTHTSDLLGGVYVVCIPTGETQAEDTTNGYFMNMDKSVDVFASKIASDPNLRNGFHAVGFSQGNNVIRGYISRYNTPTVHTFLSINGVNAGEGTVPGCFPNKNENAGGLASVCDLLL